MGTGNSKAKGGGGKPQVQQPQPVVNSEQRIPHGAEPPWDHVLEHGQKYEYRRKQVVIWQR